MSELNYLEKLLDGVEVEWKTLGEVAKYVRGLIYSKSSESADGQGYKVLRANNITLSNNCLNLNDVKVVRFDTKVKSSQKLYKNDILISAASGSREHVGKVAYIESDIDYYFGGFMGVVRCDEKLNPRYLFHVLTSDIFQKYLDEMLNSSTINNLNSAVMGRFKIPLPCPDTPEKSLAIQSEIVRILDKFTALTAELTAELTARKKQYNYYRDQLLSFDEEQEKPIYLEKLLDGVEVEWKTLGEVAKYVRGLIYSKSSESADGQGYKVLRANNITLSNNCLNLNDVKVVRFDTKVKSSQKLYKNDILISAASGSREHVGKVAYIESDIDYYFGGFMGVVRCDEKLNPRYLFHVLTSDIFQKYLDEMLNSSTINNLNSAVMGRFKIPLPCPDTPEKSLAIQSEIVRILDKFDTLTNSITEGLPREIELRQKQYEYYRDLLFSFPKPDSVTN